MKKNIFDDNIDFGSLFRRFASKWYYFAITLLAGLAIAFLYIETASRYYKIQASVQLKDNTYKYDHNENFTVLSDLLNRQTVVEDEIGLLSSLDIVERTLDQLNFMVAYYEKDNFLGIDNSREIYNDDFRVILDKSKEQPVYLPVHVRFLENNKIKVFAEGKDIYLYDLIADKLSTAPVPEISVEQEFSIFAPIRSKYLNFELALDSTTNFEPGEEYYFVINTRSKLIKAYHEKLQISRLSGESNIIQLTITGREVDKEKDFLNTLVQTYIDRDLQKKNQFGIRAMKFIDKQIDKVSDSLKIVEGVLQSFRTDKNIMDIGMSSQTLSRRLNQLEIELAELNLKNQYYKNIAQSLMKEDNINDIVAPSSVGIADPLLNNLLVELAKLQQEKVAVNYSSAKNNPVLKVLDQKIENTKKIIVENIDNLISSTQMAIQETDRNRRITQNQLNQLPENERSLTDIQRKFTLNDNVYNFLLQKKAEAGIAVASTVPDKSIIDKASMVGDGPVSPNILKVLVLAILASLLFPLGLVAAKDFFDDRIKDKQELRRVTDIPILESIVRAEYSNKASNIKNKLVVKESFKFARANLQYLYGNTTCKVIGVTSSIAGEGKTFCSAHLSASFASSGKKTLLICGDLHRPRIQDHFKLTEGKPGIADYLKQQVGLDEAIQHTEVDYLDVISPGNVDHDPSGLLEYPQMNQLFAAVRSDYTYVIVETPPLGYVADYFLIMKHFDINLLVVRYNYTDKKVLVSTEELLKEKQVKNLNILFNGVKNNGDAQYKYRKKLANYHHS